MPCRDEVGTSIDPQADVNDPKSWQPRFTQLLSNHPISTSARLPVTTHPPPSPPCHTPSMSKHVKDATRFTATGVWAHTRPGGRASTLQFAEPAPKNETPQQKVKRLREAANRAKMAQVTKWDYAYLYGRMAADAAHRFTVYGLIFATGTSASLCGQWLGHWSDSREKSSH